MEDYVQKLHESVIATLNLAITRLYRLPAAELRVAKPSLEEIIRLCALFHNVVENTDIDGEFLEAIDVLKEASAAAKRDDEQTLTDCAYHLEDFLSRIQS